MVKKGKGFCSRGREITRRGGNLSPGLESE